MVAADGAAVAVAHDRHHRQLRLEELDAGGEGERAPVRALDHVEILVGADAPGTADAVDLSNAVLVKAQVVDGARERRRDGAVAAAGAPDVGQLVDEEVLLEHLRGGKHHAISLMRARICSGRGMSPSMRPKNSTGQRPAIDALHLAHQLAQVALGHQNGLGARGHSLDVGVGEGPDGDGPQQAGLDALLARHVHRLGGGARHRAEGEDDDFGVLQALLGDPMDLRRRSR